MRCMDGSGVGMYVAVSSTDNFFAVRPLQFSMQWYALASYPVPLGTFQIFPAEHFQ